LLGGFIIALLHHGLTLPAGADTLVKGGWIAKIHTYPVEMAQNFWTAIFAFTAATLLTVFLSLMTKKIKSDDELQGLVYSLTPKLREKETLWYRRSSTLAVIILILVTVLTILFW
jgi:SSS family solute:Na+ symporter